MTQAEANPVVVFLLEVWGGNEPVDASVELPGMDAWVYSVPFGNSQTGGDVHFVSSCGSGRVYRMMIADVSGHGRACLKSRGCSRSDEPVHESDRSDEVSSCR